MPSLPTVAIVGRPNVGKSSLLNAIAGKLISIVQDMPGVTRDRVSIPIRINDHYVELVDTGGYGFVDPDQLTDHIKHQIELAMTQAQLVLFIVDCKEGRTTADEAIASMLRRKGIKTVLIANKADGPNAEQMVSDFARLGMGTPLGVSATTGRNLDQIADVIAANVDLTNAPTEPPQPTMMVAIVGKRNAGKSTLVNSIAEIYEGHGDRVIVSEIPGTTRDSVDVRFEKDGKTLVVIDTAGVRKKKHMVTNDIEFYSFHRAQRSIRRADVVMMLIDGTEPVSEPDKKLAQYIAEEYKPVILVLNKWDLTRERVRGMMKENGRVAEGVDDSTLMESYREYLDQELRKLEYAPIAFITAKEGKNIQGLLDLSQHLYKQANERVPTHKLNEAIRAIMGEKSPSTASGRRARIYYVTQTEVAPPTILLFVNSPDLFSESYLRFLMSRLRELLPYAEVPIKLELRARERQTHTKALDEDTDRQRPTKPRPVARASAAKKTVGRKVARQKAVSRKKPR